MLIWDQFGIFENLQISPIPKANFLVGIFICRFSQQTGSSKTFGEKVVRVVKSCGS